MRNRDHIQGLYFCKNTQSIYTAISTYYAVGLGCQSSDEMIGRTDHESHSPIAELADTLVAEDKMIVDSQCKSTFIKSLQFKRTEKPKIYLLEKTPLLNQDHEITGIAGMGVEIPDSHPAFRMLLLWNHTLYNDKPTQFSFEIGAFTGSHMKLTEREDQCLFFTLRGKTSKEIAKILNISYKTAERHIENLKNKTQTKTKSQLIEKCLSEGLGSVLPKSLL